MTCKRLKFVSIIFLSIVYFVASCLGSMSFAITSSTGYENVEEGVYYLENQGNYLYASDLDYYSVVMNSFNGEQEQRWEFIYVSNGYYNIRNVYTGKYLTAPADTQSGSLVGESSLMSSIADRQLWSFTQIYLEEENTFVIQAKSQETSDLYLASDDTIGTYGYSLIQSEYLDDEYDEWTIYPAKTAYLVGIDFGEAGHDHTSALTAAYGRFASDGYFSNLVIEESLTVNIARQYLRNSNVFILRAHGGVSETSTRMYLNQARNSYLDSWDIYHYGANNGMDLSDCDVAAFVGCQTANHPTQSLPQAAVDAGADVAIGFMETIYCTEAEAWVNSFSLNYTSGYDAEDAAALAVLYVGRNSSVASMSVKTQN